MKTVTMGATECLDILDQLKTGQAGRVEITEQGKVVAVLSLPAAAAAPLHGMLRGTVTIPDGFDLTEPVLDEPLDAENGEWHAASAPPQ